jgi:hypothetical protein
MLANAKDSGAGTIVPLGNAYRLFGTSWLARTSRKLDRPSI